MNVPHEATDGLQYLEEKGVADAVRSYVEEKINSDELDILADDAELFQFIDEIEKKWNIDVLSEDLVRNNAVEYYDGVLKGGSDVWEDESLKEYYTEDRKKKNSAQVLFNGICYGIGVYIKVEQIKKKLNKN